MDPQHAQKVTAQEAIEQLEFELAHPERTSQGDGELLGAITDEHETNMFLDWLVRWLSRKSGKVEEG